MAMNLAAVRAGIKDTLGPLNLNIYDYQTMRPTLPAAVVMLPPSINPRIQFGGTSMTYRIPVQVLVGAGDPEAADEALERLLAEDDDGSVLVCLRADTTLGGACESAEVVDISGGSWIEFADGSVVALGYTFMLEVMT